MAKISANNANRIARCIAEKAFSHLIGPIRKRSIERCTDYYETNILPQLDIPLLINLGIMQEVDDGSGGCEIFDGHGNSVCGYYRRTVVSVGWRSSLKLTDEALYNDVDAMDEQLSELNTKQRELMGTLEKQLLGNTTTNAIKAWPEAADIIADICNITLPIMTVPLEQLLAKFLPMLPAPKEE